MRIITLILLALSLSACAPSAAPQPIVLLPSPAPVVTPAPEPVVPVPQPPVVVPPVVVIPQPPAPMPPVTPAPPQPQIVVTYTPPRFYPDEGTCAAQWEIVQAQRAVRFTAPPCPEGRIFLQVKDLGSPEGLAGAVRHELVSGQSLLIPVPNEGMEVERVFRLANEQRPYPFHFIGTFKLALVW